MCPALTSNFVDEANVNVRAGDGGAGCVSVRREAHVPKGGPDGGDGGKGGDVWLIADRNVASLSAFKDHPHRRAENGTHGSGKKRHGTSGHDLDVGVPEGTVVYGSDGRVLTDLVHHGDRWLAAAGGRGGRGNARFLSNRRRAPSFAEQGEHGDERWVRLELKLLADVALVGFPNVGKSTLISRISAARPKIADYPFTTLEPNLGVVRLDDGAEFVVADIPGLIEGASDGRGLGLQFLRHIERARVLVLLLDLAAETGLPEPDDQERVLLAELGQYQPDLLDRPRIVVGSRADVAAPVAGGPALRISGVTGLNVDRLVGQMATTVQAVRDSEPVADAFVVHRPVEEGFEIVRADDGSFVVTGRDALRAVALSDLTNPDALDFAQHRLRKLGVDRALARAGAAEGDTVRIGDLSFDYEADA
ncbi:MAG: GTPase ObgE [Actinobacteria bacterium]|nr:GTPase ObgE [Actinomycetota bacterium]